MSMSPSLQTQTVQVHHEPKHRRVRNGSDPTHIHAQPAAKRLSTQHSEPVLGSNSFLGLPVSDNESEGVDGAQAQRQERRRRPQPTHDHAYKPRSGHATASPQQQGTPPKRSPGIQPISSMRRRHPEQRAQAHTASHAPQQDTGTPPSVDSKCGPERMHQISLPAGFDLLTYDHDFHICASGKPATPRATLNLHRGTFALYSSDSSGDDPPPALRSTDVRVDWRETTHKYLVVRGTFRGFDFTFCLRIFADTFTPTQYKGAGVVHTLAMWLGTPANLALAADLFIYNPFPPHHKFNQRRSEATQVTSNTLQSCLEFVAEACRHMWHGVPPPLPSYTPERHPASGETQDPTSTADSATRPESHTLPAGILRKRR